MKVIKNIRNFGITLMFIVGAYSVNAQVKYGPVLGVNMSSYDGQKIGLGAEFGVFAKIELLDRFGWMPEVRFGTRASSTVDAAGVKTKYSRSAVDIYLISFYIPFSDNLNAWVGYRTSTYSNGKAKTPNVPDMDILVGGNKGLFVGLIYETVSGFNVRVNATMLNIKDGETSDISTSGMELSLTATYAISW